MNAKSAFLLGKARMCAAELAQHPVLGVYWPELSLMLKGSTARGNADRYSDIDLYLVCDDEVRSRIVTGYRQAGLTQREDGIFMFFAGPGYDGHYHVEAYSLLERYYRERVYIHAWEYENSLALHDPNGRFVTRVEELGREMFGRPLEIVKEAYLRLQLDLDWLRHPLRRGDGVSAYLHAAKIVQGICQTCYLLDKRPYPPDKWLIHYLGTTQLGKSQRAAILDYAALASASNAPVKHCELAEYPVYMGGRALIETLGHSIERRFGAQPWLDHWWEFV